MRHNLADFSHDDLVLIPGDAAGLEFMPLIILIDGQGQTHVFDPVHFKTGESQFPGDVFNGQAVEINEVCEP